MSGAVHSQAGGSVFLANLMSNSGYALAPGPEVEIVHWFYKEGDEKLNSSRYLELWLPITKK